MAVSWGFAILLTGPSMSAIEYEPRKDFCVEDWVEWYPKKAHVAFVFAVNCMIPIISMTILYSRIIYKLWHDQEEITGSVQHARLRARKRVTVMLIKVTLIHTLCWSPNYVLYLLIFYVPGFYYGSTTYDITVLLVLLNASADPLLYTWYLNGFKRGMRSMLCNCHRNRVRILVDTSARKTAKTAELDFSGTMQPSNNDGMETSTFWHFEAFTLALRNFNHLFMQDNKQRHLKLLPITLHLGGQIVLPGLTFDSEYEKWFLVWPFKWKLPSSSLQWYCFSYGLKSSSRVWVWGWIPKMYSSWWLKRLILWMNSRCKT